MGLMSMFMSASRYSYFIDRLSDSNGIMGKFVDWCKEKVSDCVTSYADTLGQDSWDNMVAKYDTENELTDEERQSYSDLATNFAGILVDSPKVNLENLENSIKENPEAWGQKLAASGVTPETVDGLRAKLENGEDISSREVYDLAVENVSDKAITTAKQQVEEFQTKAETQTEATTADQSSHDAKVTAAEKNEAACVSSTGIESVQVQAGG